MKDEGLWLQQRLIRLWSIDHHLSGLNMSFVIEKACQRLGKLKSDLIAMMADIVSANGVVQKDLVSNGEPPHLLPPFLAICATFLLRVWVPVLHEAVHGDQSP